MSAWELTVTGILLLTASVYLGTGWSLIIFQFPSRPKLTVDNYYEMFVPPVHRATRFFTWWTMVMIAAAIALIVAEWHSAYVIAPVILLAGVIAATVLTVKFIIPWNKRLEHVTDNAELQDILRNWMRLNVVRVSLWTVQWAAIATYVLLKAR
jgi:hypothetical protein